jgi:hypothetical protein
MKRFIPKLLLLGILGSTQLHAQETTATLSGLVLDGKGSPLISATISVKHEPTGYVLATQANNKGIFTLPNLRPGGPYTILITSTGFKADTLNDVYLTLGNNPAGNITLEQKDQMLTEVVVTTGGRRSGLAGTTVGRAQLTTMPTLGRSLSDFTRLTPQSNNNSFAGTNFRYNNLTVDGAVNNDAIGFSNSFGGVSGGGQSGAAGSGTRTNPYSLDVIQEVQVQLAPYDVKLGNFTGGSVNAVTKSGTNDFHGDIYGYGRNQTGMGKSVDGLKTKIGSDFHDYQWGATIGGPIIRNKLFFIANYEQTRRQEPTFYNAGDPGAAVSVADATAIYNQLKNKYGYDAGSYVGAYKIFTNSDKFFARVDYNIDANNTLTVRGIYTKGVGNNLERTSTNFQFGSTDFTQTTKNYNLTAELKSKLSNSVSNQFNVSYINVHEFRDFPGTLSPLMDIGGGAVWVGTWREASIYNMKQQTFELTDNVTYTKGINKFTFGTHNEFYNLTYGFVNSWNGRWEYSNLNSFLADQPSRIRGAYTIDPAQHPNTRESLYNNPPNPYKVSLLSAYAQDEVTVSRTLKLTPGLRVDYPKLGNDIPVDADFAKANSNTLNATYSSTPYNAFTNKWLGTATLSPRIGFNWDVKGNQKLIVRGGAGIFVGRMPFAWLGYAETLTGGVYNNIDFKPSASNTVNGNTTIPLAINPLGLKDTINAHALASANAANTREVDVIDNKFKLPRVIRTNLAADYKFGQGYKLTVDVLYTKTLYDVQFQQINLKDQVEYYNQGPAESPVYVGGKLNSQYSNVYLLTNTKEGYRYNLTAQLSKTYRPVSLGHGALNVNWSAAYTYGVSKDLSNGIRNSFQSNYEVNPAISPNNPQLAYSNFDLRHRIVATLGSSWMWNAKNTTSLTFFYSGQSGNPYSVVYNSSGNPFGNAANANLPYIPKDQSDIRLVDKGTYTAAQQWQDLNNLIENDKYLKTRRGQYAGRNGLRTPWNHELDMKLMHTFNLSTTNKQHTLAVSLDVFNVLNLLNSDWGHITFVTNVNNYTVNMLNFVGYATDVNGNPIAGSTTAVGKPSSGYIPTFTYNKPTGLGGHYYTVDPINSRWQGQLGIKYSF